MISSERERIIYYKLIKFEYKKHQFFKKDEILINESLSLKRDSQWPDHTQFSKINFLVSKIMDNYFFKASEYRVKI